MERKFCHNCILVLAGILCLSTGPALVRAAPASSLLLSPPVRLAAGQLQRVASGGESLMGGLTCDVCKVLVALVQELWDLNKTKDEVASVVEFFCEELKIEDRNVCSAIVPEFKVRGEEEESGRERECVRTLVKLVPFWTSVYPTDDTVGCNFNTQRRLFTTQLFLIVFEPRWYLWLDTYVTRRDTSCGY